MAVYRQRELITRKWYDTVVIDNWKMLHGRAAASSHVWNAAALLSKAKRYIEQMQSYNHDDWQFAFWSSLALELIARASLAKVSPALLAENTEWTQLYFALGHTPTTQKFIPKSIGISEVLTRLQAINPEFEKELRDFCSIHTGMRNAELHSAELPFEDLKTTTWLWKFYRSCEVLLTSLNVDLSGILGPEEAAFAKRQIVAAKDEAAKVVLGTIKSFKEVWQAKPEKERKKLADKGRFRREVQPRRQHWFLNEKSGFPFRTPAFCSVSRGQRRLGEKEYRAPSVTQGVALRVRTQARRMRQHYVR